VLYDDRAVTFITRDNKKISTSSSGEPTLSFKIKREFQINTNSSRLEIPVKTLSQLSQQNALRNGVFLLCTKAYDAKPFIQRLVSLLEKEQASSCPIIPMYLFQNGTLAVLNEISSFSFLDKRLKLIPVINTHGTYLESNGDVTHATKGTLTLPQQPETLNIFPSILNPKSVPSTEFTHLIWKKLLINSIINPLTTLYGCRNGELLDNIEAMDVTKQLVSEFVPIFTSQLGGYDGRSDWYSNPDAMMSIVVDAMRLTAANYSSMYQDIKFKRRSEIDYFNGYLLALNHTPCNASIVSKVKEMEKISTDE
jgi:2-dehydropantoate 2-reductase